MSEPPPIEFPKSAEAVVATLAELFRHQGNFIVSDLLDNAKPRIEESGYDNWDGGQYFFTLHLVVPLKVFALVETDVKSTEELISGKLSTVIRDTGNLHLNGVTISPMLEQPPQAGQPHVAPVDYEHLWDKGMLRLFLSHVSAHKQNVAKLKAAFRLFGISAFVAHEDIEPNSLWQGEIELALKSMDALVALLTPDFHQSNWTDQEVGFALGRNVVVIPVRLGQDPYGFIGKQQGLPSKWDELEPLASDIVDLLLKHKTTHEKMREALVCKFENATSFNTAIAISKKISALAYVSADQLRRLQNACVANETVKKSWNVPTRIQGIVEKFNPPPVKDPQF